MTFRPPLHRAVEPPIHIGSPYETYQGGPHVLRRGVSNYKEARPSGKSGCRRSAWARRAVETLPRDLVRIGTDGAARVGLPAVWYATTRYCVYKGLTFGLFSPSSNGDDLRNRACQEDGRQKCTGCNVTRHDFSRIHRIRSVYLLGRMSCAATKSIWRRRLHPRPTCLCVPTFVRTGGGSPEPRRLACLLGCETSEAER